MEISNNIDSRIIVRNASLNTITRIVLLLLNLFLIPLILNTFGLELYGILSVTWMLLSHINWLDLGLSRATARFVSIDLANNNFKNSGNWLISAIFTNLTIGFLAAIIILFYAPSIALLFKTKNANIDLVILTLRLFALAIPIVLVTRSLNGFLEALQKFGWINIFNIMSTIITYLIYIIGVILDGNFYVIIYGLILLNIFKLLLYLVLLFYISPELVKKLLNNILDDKFLLKKYKFYALEMFKFGGWISVTSAISPFLLYIDRWLISIYVGIALLPYYTIPFNLLFRLQIFPGSLTSTLFPAFTQMNVKKEINRIEKYFIRSNRYLLFILIPIFFILFLWSHEFFTLWLGEEFAQNVKTPFRLMIVGFFIGLQAPIAGSLLQGIGKPDVLAKIYLFELPLNLILVTFLTINFGISGAALSYTIRTVIETILIWVILSNIINFSLKKILKDIFRKSSIVLILMIFGGFLIRNYFSTIYSLSIGTFIVLIIYIIAILIFLFDAQDRNFVKTFFKTRFIFKN